MHLSELDFEFPEGLIAQQPADPRDSCRLMYLPGEGPARHLRFTALPELLKQGDTVVFNDSRVLSARVEVQKPTGGKVELLFLHPVDTPSSRSGEVSSPPSRSGQAPPRLELWEVLARPSHRLRPGGRLLLAGGEELLLHSLLGEGRWLVEGPAYISVVEAMERYGRLPLPPYIRAYEGDLDAYQTVYAVRPGSAAAPTAGLHFTPQVLDEMRNAGIGSAHVTLHVGLDTFQPIREEIVEQHRIHREAYSLSRESLGTLRETRARGGRLVAVGTTAARVLETLASQGLLDEAAACGRAAAAPPDAPASDAADREVEGSIHGATDIFITPGYRFLAVDALLTNFHLPRSTVLALVMAFAGKERILSAYREAIGLSYRFFSFGDAMLIEPEADSAGNARGPMKGRSS